mgnify:CR=1 FL=1
MIVNIFFSFQYLLIYRMRYFFFFASAKIPVKRTTFCRVLKGTNPFTMAKIVITIHRILSIEYCHPGCGARHAHHYYKIVRPYNRGPVYYRGHGHHKRNHGQPVYRTYQYQPPRPSCRVETRSYSRPAPAPQYRHQAPAVRQQAPVQRPSVRPVPKTQYSSGTARQPAQVASNQQPTRVYRVEQPTQSSSTQTRQSSSSGVTRTSQRVRVW